jgi:serine/threonine protein kinase
MMRNSDDLVGKVLGTCTLLQLIGQGGMGAVYLAQQSRPTRRVAIKVLLPHVAVGSAEYREFRARFQREANLVAQLEHVNIVPIYEYGEQDGMAFLVMPLLTGGSLRDMLAKRGALPLSETLLYIEQAAAALDYAHAHGVIHRDLKPANFLLHADGRLVLADFGIARIMQTGADSAPGTTLTGTGMFVGTPEYMAPEMANGESIDHRADIYELGIVLFQMLSGHVPFKGNTPLVVVAMHLRESLPFVHTINPAIPPAADSVIQKAAAKKREDRFMSATALAQDLRMAMYPAAFPLEASARNDPTVLVAPPPLAPTVTNQAMETPPAARYEMNSESTRQRAYPTSDAFSPASLTAPITYPKPRRSSRSGVQPLLLFIGILLVIALVIGGVLIGLQVNKGGGNPTVGISTSPTSLPASKTSTSIPTNVATAMATTVPTSTPTTAQANSIPKGNTIYYTARPGASNSGKPCDAGNEHWANYNTAQLTCQQANVMISNPGSSLAGTLLLTLPQNAGSYPSNYVVEAQLLQASSSRSDFGIYFRNQPGNAAGIYTFLLHPDGSWSSYVYDNQTGASTQIDSGGIVANAYSSLTMDVVANGAEFTFYVNGNKVGTVHDTTYLAGTAGIAVEAGGTVFASNFYLYTVQ